VERQPVVKIFGEKYRLKARVKTINGFSAHADRDELLAYADQLGPSRLRSAFVVHGEETSSLALAEGLQELGIGQVFVPQPGEVFEL
jgi:metallo-beta-lactamase family protein